MSTCAELPPDHTLMDHLRADPPPLDPDLVDLDRLHPVTDQPAPRRNNGKAVWELVIDDMRNRDHVGRERYGTPLQAHNGRDALVDLYQELLDAVVYIRQVIEERSHK